MLSGIANSLGVAAILFFTYYFSIAFSRKPPEPVAESQSARETAKKVEELHAQERKLLTTYGVVNPALKTVRIPVERAMELIAAESARLPAANSPLHVATAPTVAASTVAPAVPSAAGSATRVEQPTIAPKPATVVAAATPATTSTSPSPPPTSPPAPVGLAPPVFYRAVCIACHDADGRGAIVRKAMPAIPDFTDPKWQLTRTDTELQHSILEGKGQLMLPMKDKFALARTDPKAMVAFIRQFQPGAPSVATEKPQAPAATSTTAVETATSAPVSTTAPAAIAPGPAHAVVTAPSTPAVAPGSASAALALSSPVPPEVLAMLSPPPAPVATLAPTPTRSRVVSAPSPEAAARLKKSAEFYQGNCAVCHSPDGRGVNLIRVAMPLLPDFTTRAWQSSHESIQLSISILDGKGPLMPPWRSKVSTEQARDLVAYVRNFGPADLIAKEAPPSEFGNRYHSLKKQWDELDQQLRALSRP